MSDPLPRRKKKRAGVEGFKAGLRERQQLLQQNPNFFRDKALAAANQPSQHAAPTLRSSSKLAGEVVSAPVKLAGGAAVELAKGAGRAAVASGGGFFSGILAGRDSAPELDKVKQQNQNILVPGTGSDQITNDDGSPVTQQQLDDVRRAKFNGGRLPEEQVTAEDLLPAAPGSSVAGNPAQPTVATQLNNPVAPRTTFQPDPIRQTRVPTSTPAAQFNSIEADPPQQLEVAEPQTAGLVRDGNEFSAAGPGTVTLEDAQRFSQGLNTGGGLSVISGRTEEEQANIDQTVDRINRATLNIQATAGNKEARQRLADLQQGDIAREQLASQEARQERELAADEERLKQQSTSQQQLAILQGLVAEALQSQKAATDRDTELAVTDRRAASNEAVAEIQAGASRLNTAAELQAEDRKMAAKDKTEARKRADEIYKDYAKVNGTSIAEVQNAVSKIGPQINNVLVEMGKNPADLNAMLVAISRLKSSTSARDNSLFQSLISGRSNEQLLRSAVTRAFTGL